MQRNAKGHATLAALFDGVLGNAEIVFDKFKARGRLGRGNGEYAGEGFLQTDILPLANGKFLLQKFFVGFLLSFQQVWNIHHRWNAAEIVDLVFRGLYFQG